MGGTEASDVSISTAVPRIPDGRPRVHYDTQPEELAGAGVA